MTDSFIPLSTPWLKGNEKEYLMECIDTGWVATGSFIRRLEESVSGYLGCGDAVAVSSGTAALHVALQLLGVGPGDAVLCPSLTFVATTNAIRYTGARPIFLDCQEETWGLDPSAVSGFLEQECTPKSTGEPVDRKTGLRIKAIIVVHLYGHPTDMDPIISAAAEHGIPVLEDATESLGSRYKTKPTGGLGQLGCLSLNGNKVITSGGGGMLVSNDLGLLEKARYLINQGHDSGHGFHHSEVGYNYRLSNLHAAVGLAQFELIDEMVAARRSNAAIYTQIFAEVAGITMVQEQSWAKSNYWLSTVKLNPKRLRIPTEELVPLMRQSGIETRQPFVPNHLLPPYRDERTFGPLPITSLLYEQGLNLPSSAWLTQQQVELVATKLVDILADVSVTRD